MRLLDRYLFRHALIPLMFCLLGFVSLTVIIDVFGHLDEIMKRNIPWRIVGEYYLMFSPQILIMALPLAILLAITFVIGNFHRHNEITAMRASGVSLTRIVSPFIMLGLLGASLIFLCSEYIIAPTTIRYEQLRDEYFEDNTSAGEPHVQIDLAIMGDENRLYHARSYDPNSHELKDVTILEHDAQKQLSGKIYARTARWERQGWVFYNGFTAQLDPLGGLLNTVQQFDRKEMHLGERPTDFEHPKIRPELMRFFHLRLYLDELNNASAMTRRRLEVELWYKLSMPFACIVMAFLGVPFSLRNRSGMLAGMGMSVLCGMLYYGMLAVCIALGKGGTLPPSIAVWVPHGVFTVFAFYLLYRVR